MVPGKQILLTKASGSGNPRVGRGIKPPIDHYTIGANEVVIDLDDKVWKNNAEMAQRFINYFKSQDIPYHLYWSGGKGLHIHVYLEDPEIKNAGVQKQLTDAIKKGIHIWKELRLAFVREAMEQVGLKPHCLGRGKGVLIDQAKLDFNDRDLKLTPIRACGGRKMEIKTKKFSQDEEIFTTWKTLLEEIPLKKPARGVRGFDDVVYPDKFELAKVSEWEVGRICKDYLDKFDVKQAELVSDIEFTGKHLSLPCVQSLLNKTEEGKRAGGAQQVLFAAKKDGKTFEEAMEIMQEYVNNCEQITSEYSLAEAERWAKNIYSKDDTYFACGLSRRLGVCKVTGCGYKQEKLEEARAVFKGTDPLDLVKRILDQAYVGDDVLKMNLFLVYLTKYFDPDNCVIIDGGSAEGKSKGAKVVADLFGPMDTEGGWHTVSRFTKSSLNHLDAWTDKWRNGIVIIEEFQGARDVLEQLRVLISERQLTLFIPQKDPDTEEIITVAKVVKIKDTLFVTCQAEDEDEGNQFRTRSWVLNTDPSLPQNQAIGKYYFDEFRGTKHIDDELKSEMRNYLSALQTPDKVVLVADQKIEDDFIYANPRSRRDVQKAILAIKGIARFYGPQRHWYREKDTGKIVLIADDRDIAIMKKWMWGSLMASSQGMGVVQLNRLRAFEMVRRAYPGVPFTVKDVSVSLGISVTTSHRFVKACQMAGFMEEQPHTYPATYELTGSPSGVDLGEKIDLESYNKAQIEEFIKVNGEPLE